MANGNGVNFGAVATYLVGLGVVAAIAAGVTAYSASSKADEAKVTAEKAETVNHGQNLQIQALELRQGHIKTTVDGNAKKLDALLQAQGIPSPTN